MRDLKPNTPHLLFQLQPQLQLYPWNGPHMPLTKIINTQDDAPLVGALAASDEPPLESTKPYRIGHPEVKGASLCIDPMIESATLKSNTTDIEDGEVIGYKPVYISGKDTELKIEGNWNVALKIDRFEVFQVNGSIDANVASEGAPNRNRYVQDATDNFSNPNRYVEDTTEEKITGEELSKRIQRFGSTSY